MAALAPARVTKSRISGALIALTRPCHKASFMDWEALH
jgi:hypothetical protein